MPAETLRAIRLTAEAARRLRRAPGAGRVHSAFARTVNLELDGLGEAGWLSLHGPGPIPSAFGIACETPLPAAGLAGAPLRVEDAGLLLGEWLRVSLAGAALVDTTLPERAPAPAIADCLARARAGVSEGLLPAVAALLTGGVPPATPLAGIAAPALAGLLAGAATRDAAAAIEAGRVLLGLGPGLTPSGDDCLVGWLAGVGSASPRGRRAVSGVGPDLLAVATARTGALSRAFLAAAVAGEVAEPLHAFIACPDRHRLDALLALGETSGADLLAGYLLARHALDRSAGEA